MTRFVLFPVKELSETPHFDDDHDHHHNAQYDHEAFLGRDESEQFDKLTPEESKHRLGWV